MAVYRKLVLGKSRIATWPIVSRQIKLLFAGLVALCAVVVIIDQLRKRYDLCITYKIRDSLEELLRIEIDHSRRNVSDSKDRWRPMDAPDCVIFSAYLDDRPEVAVQTKSSSPTKWAVIRIITIMPLNTDEKSVDCIYKYDGVDGQPRLFRRPAASAKAIRENWAMKYSPFFILCDLEVDMYRGSRFLPTSVGASLNKHTKLENVSLVEVHYPKGGFQQKTSEGFLAVCVGSFHHHFDEPLRLIEFIEYYRLLGAEHFTFYNASASANVSRVLEYYVSQGNVTVLPWHLPPAYVFEKTLRVEGIFAALNDCLYRSTFYHNYTYVAGVDVDEFIVPRRHDNFRELMSYLDPKTAAKPYSKHAAFLFRNAFFYFMYTDDQEKKEAGIPYLFTQAKTTRVATPNEPKTRSKYIVRGKDVLELGNHFTWELRHGSRVYSGFDEVPVDVNIGLLHHYRACEYGNNKKCLEKPTIVDKTAHKFTSKLGKRVAASCSAIFAENGCPEPNIN